MTTTTTTQTPPDLDGLAEAGLIPVQRLSRDLRAAAASLTLDQVRYLVDLYYEEQEQRIRAAAQVRTSEQQEKPNALLSHFLGTYDTLENNVRRVLAAYADAQPISRWAQSVVGIGPVIAAGLRAHIDIARSTNVSKLWAFAGYDPTRTWDRGQKRPHNARLKVLCWKASESFVKTCNHPRSFYGPLYKSYKADYLARNNMAFDEATGKYTVADPGAESQYAERAASILTGKRWGKDTDAYAWYSRGMLPPAHIHAMAERKVAKLFLSHYWQVSYELAHGIGSGPQAWVLAFGGHTDMIQPPGWPMLD